MLDEEKKENDKTTEETQAKSSPDLKSLLPNPDQLAEMSKKEAQSEDSTENSSVSEKDNLIEVAARAQGWTSQEEFEKNPNNEGKKWKSAFEYLEAAPLVERIKSQTRQIEELKGVNATMIKMLQNQIDKMTDDKANELLVAKRSAIAEGDVEKTEEFEKKYNDLVKDRSKETSTNIPEEYKAFAEANRNWFHKGTKKNEEMVNFAEAYNETLGRSSPYTPINDRLAEVKKAVMRTYPDEFANPNREKPPTVEKSTTHTPNKEEITYHDLPLEAQQVINNLVPQFKFKNNQELNEYRNNYAKDLLKSGAIKYK